MKQHETPEHVQTIVLPSELAKLKEITQESTSKEALRVAIQHTIKTYKKQVTEE